MKMIKAWYCPRCFTCYEQQPGDEEKNIFAPCCRHSGSVVPILQPTEIDLDELYKLEVDHLMKSAGYDSPP